MTILLNSINSSLTQSIIELRSFREKILVTEQLEKRTEKEIVNFDSRFRSFQRYWEYKLVRFVSLNIAPAVVNGS